MWLPRSIFDLFSISKEAVEDLKLENSTLKIERDLLKADLASSRANSEWMRVRLNALEFERAGLLDKVYGLRVPVPEIARTLPPSDLLPSNLDIFTDVGDKVAKTLGLPLYGDAKN